MEASSQPTLAREIAGAMAWWREAGVDCQFSDEATRWLKEDESPEPGQIPGRMVREVPQRNATVEPERPRIGGDSAGWPQDLAAFHSWWKSEPSLDAGQVAHRVAPRGTAGAEVMILVEQPEAVDNDSLLSGEQGQMLAGMLAAMAVPVDAVYFASVLPRHTPMPDWDGLRTTGIGDVLVHHVGLVAPRRVIAFGSNIPSLLGNDPAQSAQILLNLNHKGGTSPVLTERSLDALQRAKAKAGFWRRWLDWTGADYA